jgi:hypothetical protein
MVTETPKPPRPLKRQCRASSSIPLRKCACSGQLCAACDTQGAGRTHQDRTGAGLQSERQKPQPKPRSRYRLATRRIYVTWRQLRQDGGVTVNANQALVITQEQLEQIRQLREDPYKEPASEGFRKEETKLE